MPTMQFNLTSFTNKNADLKAGASFSAYASGTGVANAMVLAVRLTLNNIRIYSTQCYLELVKGSGVGRTVNFAQNSDIHSETVALSEFVSALAQSGDGPIVFTVRASAGSTGNMINLRDNVSGVLEIDYFIPQSDFSLDKTELDAGQTITATITPTHPDADHVITWRFQTAYKDYSSSHSDSGSHSTPFAESLTVPLSWLDAIPDAESGLATVRVDTYMGGVITGSVTKQFTIKAGAAILPSITSLTADRINNGVPAGWAEYVQGISGVRLTANGVAAAYGSPIVETKITGGGYTGASSPFDTGAINAVGTVQFVCEVKDSRGRKNTAYVNVTFVAYSHPQITSLDAIRCNQDGTPNDSGTYVKVTATYTIASVNEKNSITSMVTSRRPYTGGAYAQLSTAIIASGTPYVAGDGFDAGASYVVKVALTDALNAFESTDIVPTESWLLHYRVGGRGVAIGMRAVREDAFEVNPEWEIYYKGMTLDQRFGGIVIPSIWPVTSGGTGLDVVAAGSYLKGAGTGALVPRTPAQVLSDIGAAAAAHNHVAGAITSGNFPSGLYVFDVAAGASGSYGDYINTLQVRQSTIGADAIISLHVANDYAVHFGLDGGTNDLFVGGWSMGANKYRVYHRGNIATMKSDAGLSPYGIGSIEFAPGAAAGHGGNIDFHYNNSALDFTSRIIEGNGVLTFAAPTSLQASGKATIDAGLIIARNNLWYCAQMLGSSAEAGILYQSNNSNQWAVGVGHWGLTDNFVWGLAINTWLMRLNNGGDLVIKGSLVEAGTALADKYAAKLNPNIDGTLHVNPGSSHNGGYAEGIRISRASNSWSHLSLGTSTALAGNTTGQWLVGTNPSQELLITQGGYESTGSNGIKIAPNNANVYFNSQRMYHAGNITNGQASAPTSMAEGDIYLQW
jgi:hypothetical protein